MKKRMHSTVPILTLGLGAAGLCLRWALNQIAIDSRGLLVNEHPLAICLWALTAAVITWTALSVRKLDGSGVYEDNFSPSFLAAAGHVAGASGILATVLTVEPMLPGMLGKLWIFSGILAAPCLIAAGACRMFGRKPFFLLHMIPCLFFVFHVINHYQPWSSEPQLLNYFFPLLGSMGLALFCFYSSAFAVDLPRRRMQLFMGLSAAFLCLTALPGSDCPWLYLGGALFAAANLCTRNPKPLPSREETP